MGRSMWRFSRIALALWLLWLLAPSAAQASSRSTLNLGAIADDYYWALQTRLLRPSFSPRANQAWVDKLEGFEGRLARIKTANLDPQGRITYRMLQADLGYQKRYVTEGWIKRD